MVSAQIRKRAGDVRQDGAYCGVFEITCWAFYKRRRILCSFGTSIQDIYQFCGSGLPKLKYTTTIRVVAVYCTDGKLLSADKPGSAVPQANHFVAANEM